MERRVERSPVVLPTLNVHDGRWAKSADMGHMMAECFVLLNRTKKEFVCPWCLRGGGRDWEWCVGPHAAVLPFLLRRRQGDPEPGTYRYMGRWAGDSVELVGENHESGDFARAYTEFVNITPALAVEVNDFVGIDEDRLSTEACQSCVRQAGDGSPNPSRPGNVS